MEKIEFYQRSAVIDNYRKYFNQTFFKILAMICHKHILI